MNWLRNLRGKEHLDREMDAEMRAHIEMQTQEHIEGGMAPEEARYAALRQFGNVGSLTERCREERGLRWLDDLLQDVRFGLRQLGKSPGFTAVAIATLALGIGSSTAIYNVVENVLFNPLPGPEPKRVMEVVEQGEHGISPDVLASLRGNRDLFSDVMWFHRLELKTRTDDFSDWVRGEMVSPNFFSFWRARRCWAAPWGRTKAFPSTRSSTGARLGDCAELCVVAIALWRRCRVDRQNG